MSIIFLEKFGDLYDAEISQTFKLCSLLCQLIPTLHWYYVVQLQTYCIVRLL